MSETEDLDGEESGLPAGDDVALEPPFASITCLSCGADVVGVFCVACGQKHDDLRRSLVLLARDFVEDTFSFDSRMWRTLGVLAAAPGIVPTNYSHGRRSRYTPPVRLFLVVSFLFFLTIGLTNTLFVALEVSFRQTDPVKLEEVIASAAERGVDLSEARDSECSFHGTLRFFVKEGDLNSDQTRIDQCIEEARQDAAEEASGTGSPAADDQSDAETSDAVSSAVVERMLEGVAWAVRNPRAFNDGVNDWLPRVMFLMTPVLALVLALFLRREAFIFDHMVLALYMHAVGFAIVGAGLIFAQLGAPLMGLISSIAIAVYYLVAIKRAYKRGWRKTVWTAFASGMIYLLVLLSVVMAITSSLVWNAGA